MNERPESLFHASHAIMVDNSIQFAESLDVVCRIPGDDKVLYTITFLRSCELAICVGVYNQKSHVAISYKES